MIDQMMLLVLQLGVIIFAAKIMGILSERIGLPAILGELIAGMLIGPYFLGAIPLPGLGEPLFPIVGNFPISPELYGFATVASIILLFLVGLETNLDMFLKYTVAGLLVGIGGVVFSFALGDWVAVIFSKYIFGVRYEFMHPVPMFLGAISTATSVGITARILSERKKMHSPEGITIIAGAIIDDVLGIVVLAVVIAIAKIGHVEWARISGIAARSFGIWLGFTALGLILSKHIGVFLKHFKDLGIITLMGLGMALILSGIFEKFGLTMIIGAYIMGLSLSQTDLNYIIRERLSALYEFFIPVFFCVMGMIVNFSAITSKYVLLFGLFYTIVSIVGKILGCSLPALLLNFNLRGAFRIGLGMMPRGEVALIITGIGLSTGILPQETLGVAIFMVLITTLLAPVALSSALKSDKPVIHKRAHLREENKQIIFAMPVRETAELILAKIITVFRNEGFYAQQIYGEEGLYQIRKDNVFITMVSLPEQLRFDCKETDVVFINTLVYEALGDLEDAIKRLQGFVNVASIGKKIFDKNNTVVLPRRNLTKNILPDAVEINLKGNTKQEIIEELVDILIRTGELDIKYRQTAIKDVLDREEVMSTGMQYGIAFPHAKTDTVEKVACAIGIKKKGVDFKSLDNQLSRIFAIILSPKDVIGPHIRLMADLSQLLVDKARREKLLASMTNTELYNAIIS